MSLLPQAIGSNHPLRPCVAVLSGKGGAGKTFVSVNLSSACPGSLYVDCDVEEPNGQIFLGPIDEEVQPVEVLFPRFNASKCTGCRTCVSFCAFNSLAFIGGVPMLFEETCHSCGGCFKLCPNEAVFEEGSPIGETASGLSEDIRVLAGRMNVGVASGVPIIRALERRLRTTEATIVICDCPPGNGCSVMESLKGADYCILVAEPTVFGAQNLSLVHELAISLGIPCGAVLNKCLDDFENPSEAYLRRKGVPILAKIPFSKELGKLNASGGVASRKLPAYRTIFEKVVQGVKSELEETKL